MGTIEVCKEQQNVKETNKTHFKRSYLHSFPHLGHHRAGDNLGDGGTPHRVGPDVVSGAELVREGEAEDVRSPARLGDSR